ncbi:Protein kinase [Phytophthora megakarya]|uniref:Protein kinase n=1 Tax=Phytophthora megakarya TaxID=4795 RepID=A0A225X4H4_9STRA|nr:Protein kinase [Phytophthora megakarya]
MSPAPVAFDDRRKDPTPSQDNCSRPTFGSVEDSYTGSRKSVDSAISFKPTHHSELSSDSNQTMKILLGSKYLQGKRIPYDNLVFVRALSKGASGEVWLGKYQGQQVAVKRLLRTNTHHADEVEEFANEIELSASLVHPNIVSVIGVAWNTLDNLVMVLEFFPTGDLQSYLKKNADLMSWAKDKVHIAAGIGRAMEYLHSRTPPLIHRDLKSKNVLLTADLEPKLIDFGVSRGLADNTMTAGVGTPYWTAPEILQGGRYSEQADIYSFGVILSELDTGKFPYHDVLRPDGKKPRPFQIMEDVMAGTLRPSFSEECPTRIRRISAACCKHDPIQRPTAAQVVKMLNGDD